MIYSERDNIGGLEGHQIALSCVEIGFGVNEKEIRVNGLVRFLLICGNITLY